MQAPGSGVTVLNTYGGCASGCVGSPAEQVLVGFMQTMRRQFRWLTILVAVAVGAAQVVSTGGSKLPV